jgi:hypothetical protein
MHSFLEILVHYLVCIYCSIDFDTTVPEKLRKDHPLYIFNAQTRSRLCKLKG